MPKQEYEAIITMQNGDIIHYGVLGMKWGQRKYANANGGSTEGFRYQSIGQKHAQKVYDKAVARDKRKGLTQESNRTARKRRVLDYKKTRDSQMQKYGEKTSTKKAIAQNLLLGGTYAKMRAHSQAGGASKTKSRAHALGTTYFGLQRAGTAASQVGALERSGYNRKERRKY